jgi:hypothetical protein
MRTLLAGLLGFAALLALAPPARADVTVYTTPINLVVDNPSRQDFIDGWKYDNDGLQVHVESTGNWTLTLHTDDPDLGPLDNSWDKDIADLQFLGPANATYMPLLDNPLDPDAVVAQGGPGTDDFFIDWRVKLRWLYDRPGSYGATLILTLSLDS